MKTGGRTVVLLLLCLLVLGPASSHHRPDDAGKPDDGGDTGDGGGAYQRGYDDGYGDGYTDGSSDAYDGGYADGYGAGTSDGYAAGHRDGYDAGHGDGFEAGYASGYEDGFDDGARNGAPGPGTPHPALACSKPFHVQGAGWDVCWQQDDLRVQGLEINQAYFQNQSVAWKMGVPFSLTKYDHHTQESPFTFWPDSFKDALGTPSAAGLPGFGRGSLAIDFDACPRFYSFGELLNNGRVCVEHRGGPSPALALWARYDAFNYRFLQGWKFDDRGAVEPFLAMGGLLLDGAFAGERGMNHFHHIYWRLDLDIAATGNDTFQTFQRAAGEFYALPLVSPDVDSLRKDAEDLRDGATGCVDAGGDTTLTLWCTADRETKLLYDRTTHGKWRVADPADLNRPGGYPRSFEFVVHSDGPANDFSTFDAMVVEHAGDSQEIGYEVPSSPSDGDQALDEYLTPPGEITDPVVWVVHHTYHDTRDEDRGTMSLHHASFPMRPRDFTASNPGEPTFP